MAISNLQFKLSIHKFVSWEITNAATNSVWDLFYGANEIIQGYTSDKCNTAWIYASCNKVQKLITELCN